jgi:hypothetical protein
VTGDDDIDLVCHVFEQSQRGEVILDRIRGFQVEERHQDVGEHVAGDENASLLDQQSRMPRRMGSMLDDPDPRSIPGDLRGSARRS